MAVAIGLFSCGDKSNEASELSMRQLLWAITLFPTFPVSLVNVPQFPTEKSRENLSASSIAHLNLFEAILILELFVSHFLPLLCRIILAAPDNCLQNVLPQIFSLILGSDLADFSMWMFSCTLFAQLSYKPLFVFVVAYCLYLVALQCEQTLMYCHQLYIFLGLAQTKLWWVNLGCLLDAHQPALLMPPPQQVEKIQ